MLSLDANASVPVLPVARAALLAALDDSSGNNPSSPHAGGRRARRRLDQARDDVATAMAAATKEIFFVAGATEGNRFVVDLLVEHGLKIGRPLVVVTSPLEHPSLHKPLARAHARGQLVVRHLPIVDGAVVVDHVDGDADAVIVTAAHNETGLLVDVDTLCAALPAHAILHVDAAQSLGRTGAPPARADIVVASAHKLGGVAGAGALVLRGRARALSLPWAGGGQEQGVRPGTEATAVIAAFGAACAVVDDTRAQHALLAAARDAIEAAAVEAGAVVVAGRHARLPNTSALLIPGVDGDALRLLLDQAGVAVGFGAACSALAPEPSPGLMALGLSAEDTRRVVRVSLAPGVTDDDVAAAQRALVKVIEKLR